MRSLLSVSLSLLFAQYSNGETVSNKLPSSCNDLADGVHYIQPLSSAQVQRLLDDHSRTAPVVKVQCSGGYTIINPKFDENIENYFSSFHLYHSGFAGPDLDDHVVWRKWWLPGRIDNQAIFTPSNDDCSACEDPSEFDHAGQTAYYMTGDLIGCNWPTKNLCTFDLDTLECSKCTPASFTSIGDDEEMWGTCGHMPYHVDFPVAESHDSCTEGISTVLPSIGILGSSCVCYKPAVTLFNEADELEVDLTSINDAREEEFFDDGIHVVRLTNEDFLHGTYRIKKPGTYVLAEDIILDFNAGDLDAPNDVDAWMPKKSQSEEYPGAGDMDGWYWLGFYAGIAVECDDVTIELNGYSIRQSDAFYLQQRWFVMILLADKPFIDTQGPTWTGVGIGNPKNIIIRGGTIGLSSHHGILGIRTENVVISDVKIIDFETHGVAFNEFSGVTMENVEIGPSTTKCYVNGRYSLARMELPILRSVAEEIGEQTIDSPKYGTISYDDLLDKLINQMDMVFNYVFYGTEYSGDEWESAYETFVNPSGVTIGGAIYGAIFRPRGASVMNFGKYDGNGYSENLIMRNVKIHHLAIDVDEIPTFGTNGEMWVRDSINAPVPFQISTHNRLDSVPGMKYTGNVWTDLVLTLKKHASSWWHLGRMSISDKVIDWAESGQTWSSHEDTDTIHCNMDSLGHLVKGVLGMKIEYVSNVKLINLEISDISALSPLGSSVCGEYHDGKDGGHALQSKVTNEGWGGSTTYGIWFTAVEDVHINGLIMSNFVSYHGRIFGLKAYDSNHEIKVTSATFSNFVAGAMLDETIGYENAWPNPAASTCAMEDDMYIGDDDDIDVGCIIGRAECTCDTVSCAGTIHDQCDGFEIDTPKHTLKIGSDSSFSSQQKSIEMVIGARKNVEEIDGQDINTQTIKHNLKMLKGEDATVQQMEHKYNYNWAYWLIGIILLVLIVIGVVKYYQLRRRRNTLLPPKYEKLNTNPNGFVQVPKNDA